MEMAGGKHSTEVLACHPADPGSIPSVPPKKFRGKIINVAEVNQRRWLEESGQWQENVDQTHLVLVSGKPAQQKI